MDRVNDAAARRHFSRHTIDCYSRWVRQFLIFCRDGQRWRTPAELGGADVSRFLTHLAAERRSARSTQTQALNAIVFLYRDVLGDELGADHLGPIDGLRVDRRAGGIKGVGESKGSGVFDGRRAVVTAFDCKPYHPADGRSDGRR